MGPSLLEDGLLKTKVLKIPNRSLQRIQLSSFDVTQDLERGNRQGCLLRERGRMPGPPASWLQLHAGHLAPPASSPCSHLQAWAYYSRRCILLWQEARGRLLGRGRCLGFKTSLLSVPAVLFLTLPCPPLSLHLMNPVFPGSCLTPGSKFYHVRQSRALPNPATHFVRPCASHPGLPWLFRLRLPSREPLHMPHSDFLKQARVERSSTLTFLMMPRLGFI